MKNNKPTTLTMFRPINLTGLDLALTDYEKYHKGDSKFQYSVSEQYLNSNSGQYPSGYQSSVTELYNLKGGVYLGGKIPAIMSFSGNYPIICSNLSSAYRVSKRLCAYLDKEQFDGTDAKCLFVKSKNEWCPVIIGGFEILDIVKRAMSMVIGQDEFMIERIEIILKDRLRKAA
jgi:hypothetical protein